MCVYNYHMPIPKRFPPPKKHLEAARELLELEPAGRTVLQQRAAERQGLRLVVDAGLGVCLAVGRCVGWIRQWIDRLIDRSPSTPQACLYTHDPNTFINPPTSSSSAMPRV